MYDKKKIKALVIVVVAFVALVIAVSIFLMLANEGSSSSDNFDGPTEADISSDRVSFNNRSALDYYIGKIDSAEVLTHLEKVILDKKERKDAPEKNSAKTEPDLAGETYDATLEEDSFSDAESETDEHANLTILEFTVSVSDGRKYKVHVRDEEIPYTENYNVTTVIMRDSGPSYAYSNTDNPSEDTIRWARMIAGDAAGVKYLSTEDDSD